MRSEFNDITYIGQEIDDFNTLEILPEYLRHFFANQNGLIAYHGGFHIRGCVINPLWHSLGYVWFGDLNLSNLFDCISQNDIPIAQDCFGDQYLIRDNSIIRLSAEIGDLEFLNLHFHDFLKKVQVDPISMLNIENIEQFKLKNGQLLSVFPPFSINTESTQMIRPIDFEQRIRYLSQLSKKINKLPDSTEIEFVIK